MTFKPTDYRGVFDGRAGFGQRPALVLIDLVEAYFDEKSPLYADVASALASALRVRQAAHDRNVPVILTNVVYDKGGRDGGRFFEKAPVLRCFERGSPLGQWPKGLEVRDDELVISKQYPSIFFGTSLASTLVSAGVDQLLLTGLTTSGCVRASCVDSVSHGFRTAIVADACGDRATGPHEANLFDMDAKYADVINEGEALSYLRNVDRWAAP